ncbi:hypothetical protein ABT173_20035 [Streptomyces sp. NPDC001795]|uniref:hypothetical protein n=1 Tax=unclassified Streptomyces TaxID=2593676 RepID=UPI00331A4FE7
MTDRGHDRYADDSGHLKDMTEETLGAQEQARQERQHRQEQQQRGRQKKEEDESTYPKQEDEYYL